MNYLHFIPLFAIGFMIGWYTNFKLWQHLVFAVLIIAYRHLP